MFYHNNINITQSRETYMNEPDYKENLTINGSLSCDVIENIVKRLTADIGYCYYRSMYL